MSPSNRFQGGHSIRRFAYDKATTALLLIDPYYDFIFQGADYSQERMHAALDVNIPSYASADLVSLGARTECVKACCVWHDWSEPNLALPFAHMEHADMQWPKHRHRAL